MSDTHEYDDHLDGGECWNCGGEGRVNDCIDGCCVEQDDPYCEYCSKRCDVCNPKRPASPELQEVLREALENTAEPSDPLSVKQQMDEAP